MPPFEGWDEYQHLAYIDAVERAPDKPVVLDKAIVRRGFLAAVLKFPQPVSVMNQLGYHGALTYAQYWSQPATPNGLGSRRAPSPLHLDEPIGIYEAQHPPLYYGLMAPFYLMLGGARNMARAVTGLRLVNLALTAGAVGIFLGWVGGNCLNRTHAALIGLAVALNPLFLINGVRVANDGLAVLLGTAVIVWTLSLSPGSRRRLVAETFGLGLLAGAAILAKVINLALLPFLTVCLFLMAARRRTGWLTVAAALLAAIAGAGTVTWSYFSFNVHHFGMLAPMGEAVGNRRLGRGWGEMIRWLHWGKWVHAWWDWWVSEALWTGGWSFLHPVGWLTHLHSLLIVILGAGWPVSRVLRHRRGDLRDRSPSIPVFKAEKGIEAKIAVLIVSVTAALTWHGLQSATFYKGTITTNAWYTAVAMPWFAALICGSGLAWRPRGLGNWLVLSLGAIFVLAEILGLIKMIHTYAGRRWSMAALRRLAELHPSGFGVPMTLGVMGMTVVLMALAFVACIGAMKLNAPPPAYASDSPSSTSAQSPGRLNNPSS